MWSMIQEFLRANKPESWDESFMVWATILVSLFLLCLVVIAILS